eukprot:TRINITY_DN9553_c0_g1_i3.p1 TRINITY_DN9553_c0_g1~~TRINITY_DN9553_c0_g1_i3.p1  ORF type:complete len:479 (+),score=148.63 TRINITY_DN9553_c0_g1_i3:52-1488(+)
MPPKKKSAKKAKKKAEPEAAAADDSLMAMTPEQLQGKVMSLKDQLDREREERNYFQLERDKINTFWEITKRQLEESRSEVRNREREIEEAQEKHAVEIKVYKQKVKHLLYEHQNQIAELRTEASMAQKMAQDEMRAEGTSLRKDKRSLKVELKELELAHQRSSQQAELSADATATSLHDQTRTQARDLRHKYEEQLDALREDLELQRKAEVHEIEERKNGQIAALMRNHERAFGDIKNYYNDITLNNLALINSLKEQVEEMKQREERTEKVMAEVLAENRRLTEPLKLAQQRVAELEKAMSNYNADKESLRNTKTQLKLKQDEVKQLEWEREVLQQRFSDVEGERDELYDRFVKTIYDVQQKTGFKNLLLEKKLAALDTQLEKKEAQLNEVLAASNLDPTAMAVVTQKLEDVMDGKNATIRDLQYEVARMSKAYNDAVSALQGKLKEHGIPVEELGFNLVPSNTTQPLGKAPAGLVAS